MARIPFVTEKVIDAIIRSLRFSGFLADDASADALKTVSNDSTEAELDAIVAGLNYGGVGGSGILSSADDLNVFIDSDDAPAFGVNYFRISQHNPSVPVTDPNQELMTVSTPGNLFTRDIDGPVLLLGPRPVLGPSLNYYAGLRIGTSSAGIHYFNVDAGPLAADGGPGFKLSAGTGGDIEIRSFNQVQFRNQTGVLMGGWKDIAFLPLEPEFHIGDWTSNDSLALERLDSGNFRFRITDTGFINTVFMRSDNTVDNYTLRFAIGGKEGEAWGDPAVTADLDATTLIVSPPLITPARRATLTLSARETAPPGLTEVFSIRSDISALGPPNTMYLMRVWQGPIGLDIPVFNIRAASSGTTDVNAPGGFITGPADVAECVVVEGSASDYSPGTVLIVGDSGKMKKSSVVADSKVIGVTVDTPGLTLGYTGDYDDSQGTLLSETPSKEGSLKELTFSGDVTSSLEGVTLLKIHHDYVSVGSAAYDSETGKTTVPFQNNSVVNFVSGMSILKSPVVKTDVVKMTICGIINVRCVTTNGSISRGDLLVSAGNGQATKAGGSPAPGTIIGKALGTLTDDGSNTVSGLVKSMVNLQ